LPSPAKADVAAAIAVASIAMVVCFMPAVWAGADNETLRTLAKYHRRLTAYFRTEIPLCAVRGVFLTSKPTSSFVTILFP
jgi:hypothetical protein